MLTKDQAKNIQNVDFKDEEFFKVLKKEDDPLHQPIV